MDILKKIQDKYPISYCAIPSTQSIAIEGTAAERIQQYMECHGDRPVLNCRFGESRTAGTVCVKIDYDSTENEYSMTIPFSTGNITFFFHGDQAEDNIWWLLYCVLCSTINDELRKSIRSLDGNYIEFACISYQQQLLAAELVSQINAHFSVGNGISDKERAALRASLVKKAQPCLNTAPCLSNRPIIDENYSTFFNSFLGAKKPIKLKNEPLYSLVKMLYGEEAVGSEIGAYMDFVVSRPEFKKGIEAARDCLWAEIYKAKLVWTEQMVNFPSDASIADWPEMRTLTETFKLSRESLKEIFEELDQAYSRKIQQKLEALFLDRLLAKEKDRIAEESLKVTRQLGEMLFSLEGFCLLDRTKSDGSLMPWDKLAEGELPSVPISGWNNMDCGFVLSKLSSGKAEWYREKYGSRAFMLCSPSVYAEVQTDPTGTQKYPLLTDSTCLCIAFSRVKSQPVWGGVVSE